MDLGILEGQTSRGLFSNSIFDPSVIGANKELGTDIAPWRQDNPVYNAYERDIAVVNIFFAKETVTGHFSLSQCWFPNGSVFHFLKFQCD